MNPTLDLPRRFAVANWQKARQVRRRTPIEVAEIELSNWLVVSLNGDRMKTVTAYDIDAGWVEAFPVDFRGTIEGPKPVRMPGVVAVGLADDPHAQLAYGYWRKLRESLEPA